MKKTYLSNIRSRLGPAPAQAGLHSPDQGIGKQHPIGDRTTAPSTENVTTDIPAENVATAILTENVAAVNGENLAAANSENLALVPRIADAAAPQTVPFPAATSRITDIRISLPVEPTAQLGPAADVPPPASSTASQPFTPNENAAGFEPPEAQPGISGSPSLAATVAPEQTPPFAGRQQEAFFSPVEQAGNESPKLPFTPREESTGHRLQAAPAGMYLASRDSRRPTPEQPGSKPEQTGSKKAHPEPRLTIGRIVIEVTQPEKVVVNQQQPVKRPRPDAGTGGRRNDAYSQRLRFGLGQL